MKLLYPFYTPPIKKVYRKRIYKMDEEYAECLSTAENDALTTLIHIARLTGFKKAADAARDQMVKRGFFNLYKKRINGQGKEVIRTDVSKDVIYAQLYAIQQLVPDELIKREQQYFTQAGHVVRNFDLRKNYPKYFKDRLNLPKKDENDE